MKITSIKTITINAKMRNCGSELKIGVLFLRYASNCKGGVSVLPMKHKKNSVIVALAILLAVSVFANVKASGNSKNTKASHEAMTIALQTCMQIASNEPASVFNGSAGWASEKTRNALAECKTYSESMLSS
jgi:hypothetical protein